MLSVVLSVIMLNVRMLSIFWPNVINVSVVMLKVLASIAKTRQGPLTERENSVRLTTSFFGLGGNSTLDQKGANLNRLVQGDDQYIVVPFEKVFLGPGTAKSLFATIDQVDIESIF
jgi:hypothetical protein